MYKLIPEKEGHEMLKPHIPAIAECYTKALADVQTIMSSVTQSFSPLSKAILINNFAVNNAHEYFSKISDVKIKPGYGSMHIIFQEKMAARFKKIDSKTLLSSNVSTKRSNSIISNQYVLFPEYAPMTFIEFGYCINVTGLEFEKIVIVCRSKKDVIWSFEIAHAAEQMKPQTLTAEQNSTPQIINEKQLKLKNAK